MLLNLSADHLDRHGTFERYASAKARIFANQTANDWAVINADDPAAMALAGGYRARRLDFAARDVALGRHHRRSRIDRAASGGRLGAARAVVVGARCPGRHLLGDVLAATAVGCVAGVPPAAMQRAVEGFTGLPHALERVADVDGVTFVNDSKATNIASARRSLESFPDGVVAIMGGRYKGGDFGDLRRRACAIASPASSRLARRRRSSRPRCRTSTTVTRASSMDEAVATAFAMAPRPGVVVLAPACSSFDMFRDYADRGNSSGTRSQATSRSGQRAEGKGQRQVRGEGAGETGTSVEQSSDRRSGGELVAGNTGHTGT